MIISFSVFKEKIESGEKHQTIRKYSAAQYRRYLNCWKKRESTGRYNLFWHNPRNGGTRIKDAVPGDRPYLISFNRSYGQMNVNVLTKNGLEQGRDYFRDSCIILSDLAKDDGFKNASEMWAWFEKEYGKDMFQSKFIVVRWVP
jgi:hypothetical protein